MAAVPAERVAYAKAHGLVNVDEAARACRRAGLPFWAACALLEKESGGANVWGAADVSFFSALNKAGVPINEDTFKMFYTLVKNGLVPTGIGPCQITYAGSLRGGKRDGGYFRQMEEEGLKAWEPEDNMFFGFRLLWQHYKNHGDSWRAAGTAYNGAASYGEDLLAECKKWKSGMGVPGSINPS